MIPRWGLLPAVALISAGLMAYEIVLMRRLVIEYWHHLGYLIISVALLGYGASGALLARCAELVRARSAGVLFWLAVALLLSLVLMPRVAGLLPVTARFIPGDVWKQVGWWGLFWLALLIPFLAGAGFQGAALMTAGPRVGQVYGANLVGSGAGAVSAALLISRLAPEYALWPALGAALLAAFILLTASPRPRAARAVPVSLCALVAVAAEFCRPLLPRYDEHKYAARLSQLAAQGSARRVARGADPHGYVELWQSDLFHDLPFLALGQRPPPMYSLVVNGDFAGSVLQINSAQQAEVLDGTLMAFPYRLLSDRPAVLLLGETGGANVWLARRMGAGSIDVVQPSRALAAILRSWASGVVSGCEVRLCLQDARSFVAKIRAPTYDLIQLVALEGFGVGLGSVRGLAEDHLATVEGLAACLRALRDDGLLAVSRGVEDPPRENVRLLATLAEALEAIGIADPGQHIIQVRDYLGVSTMAARKPLSTERLAALRGAIREFNLTPIWYQGILPEEVNLPDELNGPPGTSMDWFHYAARQILSPQREQFYDSWLLHVRPARDDRPFFWDFYKPAGLAALKRTYGDLWLTRAELGRLFLYVSLAVVGLAALLLILVPLVWAASHQSRSEAGAPAGPGRLLPLIVVVYFSAIGLGFMAIEMTLISRVTHWLGDPVVASALTIGGVLVASGLGSLAARYVAGERLWLAPALVAIAAGGAHWVGWADAGEARCSLWMRLALALVITFFMGMPMVTGIAVLNRRRPSLVPWAWGTNGVASVAATSGAILAAMTAGYRLVMVLAAVAYALAAWSGPVLVGRRAVVTTSHDMPAGEQSDKL